MSIFLKLLIFIAGFLLIQTILYFGIEIFEGEPHDVERSIDRHIPVRPKFAYIYATWFALIAITPFILFYSSERVFMIYMGAMAVDIVISILCYIIYPTSFTRPPNDSWELRIVYRMSFKQINCAPSMHCSMSFIVLIAAIACTDLPIWICALLIADSILIPVSTLYTKQHVVIDVITAIPVAVISWLSGNVLFDSGFLSDVFSFIV